MYFATMTFRSPVIVAPPSLSIRGAPAPRPAREKTRQTANSRITMSTSGGRGDEEERRNVHRARSQIERPNGQRRTDARFIHEAVANQTALSRAEAVISQANKMGAILL